MDNYREKYERKAKSREWAILANLSGILVKMKGNYDFMIMERERLKYRKRKACMITRNLRYILQKRASTLK